MFSNRKAKMAAWRRVHHLITVDATNLTTAHVADGNMKQSDLAKVKAAMLEIAEKYGDKVYGTPSV